MPASQPVASSNQTTLSPIEKPVTTIDKPANSDSAQFAGRKMKPQTDDQSNQCKHSPNHDAEERAEFVAKISSKRITGAESNRPALNTVYTLDSYGNKTAATQEDLAFIQNRSGIKDFSNIDYIPSKIIIEAFERELQAKVSLCEPTQYILVGPAGVKLSLLPNQNAGIEIPSGAVDDNILIVMGSGTGIKANQENDSNKEALSPLIFILPCTYTLKKEGTMFTRYLTPSKNKESFENFKLVKQGNKTTISDLTEIPRCKINGIDYFQMKITKI